jgi:hypothetical protein
LCGASRHEHQPAHSKTDLALGFTPVDYGGNHERCWKLAGGDPYQLGVEYLDRAADESLRIKFITDPIKGSASYSPLFEDTLQKVSP